ncbi:hypothetical protein MDA_GLEAN10001014 [Myotis davidii]|uniref:Uncharacterized protein n=1 Tax=Myotis davidii TaxID=225400 RepID=L5M3H2_MYODS|nr:hypothetical protein MDA_GLEAN10001014 [Myotis davidii]
MVLYLLPSGHSYNPDPYATASSTPTTTTVLQVPSHSPALSQQPPSWASYLRPHTHPVHQAAATGSLMRPGTAHLLY